MTPTTQPLAPIVVGTAEWHALRERINPTKHLERVCDGCNETFKARRSTHRYCSPKCYLRVRRRNARKAVAA